MRAISAFNLDAGTSTRECFAATAFRTRVSMSEIGSVISLEPCGFSGYTGCPGCPGCGRSRNHLGITRETRATWATVPTNYSSVRPRAPAQLAAIAQPNLVLRGLRFFCNLGRRCHRSIAPEWQPDELQQLAG